MYKKVICFVFCLIAILNLSSCAAQPKSDNTNYPETKRMVIDMLKTDEGKETIKDILKDNDVKKELVLDHAYVKDTIIQQFETKEGQQYWSTLISNPEFAGKLAKTMESKNEDLLKQLMKDPSYQSMMMDILKDPNMQNEYLDLMKTKKFRSQMQKVVADTLASPLFATQLSGAIEKAVKTQLKAQQAKSQ
ncbi:spore gernimation protein GerD [Terrilactibacillus sp. BCM23-1]|uniref:Spore gernimation protein GerD n=1 Tax=Terrilactibacillus tamarindi TaxID=2599694 RepID=A0A6N8CW39_9BACI|nr:spore germination lipoprotein GerD [Terrilactibacillus tamarindi]MTT32726.1 spore gernimation protein GerD [Terrilactibacillus tamarindi]